MNIKKILNLNNIEIKIMNILKNGSSTSKKLSIKLKKDVSIINRYLNDLISKGLVYKISKCCTPNKGRYYIYSLKSKKDLKSFEKSKINEIKTEIDKFLKSFYN